MFRVRYAFAALLLVPAIAFAQKSPKCKDSMGGSCDADWNSVAGKTAPSGPTISSKDFENTSPFKFILDKKKDLKLTDAQLASFKDADAKLKETNKDKLAAIDSLKREAKPRTSGTPEADELARLAIARDALSGVAHEVQTKFDEAAKSCLPMLDAAQQPAGQKVLDKYAEEMRDLLKDKLGVRGGGDAPAGGRGRGRGV